MQIGELYYCNLRGSQRSFWAGKVFLYVGPRPLHRDDGVIVNNHIIHMDGGEVIVDGGILKHFRKLEKSLD